MCASTNTTWPPLPSISVATRLPRSTSRSANATFAPSVTNRRTVASPIPDAPPETAATFPLSLAMLDASLSAVRSAARDRRGRPREDRVEQSGQAHPGLQEPPLDQRHVVEGVLVGELAVADLVDPVPRRLRFTDPVGGRRALPAAQLPQR